MDSNDTQVPATPNSDAFFRAAAKAIVRIARKQEFFTTDDLWSEIPAEARPSEPRALGGFITQVAKNGTVIARTDRVQTSKRKECNRRPIKVWKSLLFKAA